MVKKELETLKNEEKKFFTYKNMPMVRCGNIIYYGDISEKYVIKMQIKSKKIFNNLEIADLVNIQLVSTNLEIGLQKQIIKTAERKGLYAAIDLSDFWLTKALSAS